MMERGFSRPGPIMRALNRLRTRDEISETSAPDTSEIPRNKPSGRTESESVRNGESLEVAYRRSREPEYPTCGISARNIRGLQIGKGNLQVNKYEYQVDRPNIDFATVLRSAAVRDALKALSNDPDNPALQRDADRALALGPLFRKQINLCVERSEISSEQRSSVLDAFIFVENSEGVQIGNNATQRNRFVYIVAPTVNAAQLLADDPTVRSAVINRLCSPNEAVAAVAGDVLRDELAAALESAVLSSPDVCKKGVLIRSPADGRLDINGGDGVSISIGKKGRQQNEAHAVAAVPETVLKSVQPIERGGGLDRDPHNPPDSQEKWKRKKPPWRACGINPADDINRTPNARGRGLEL